MKIHHDQTKVFAGLASLAALLCGAPIDSASAATATTTFQVTANVVATCSVSAGTVAFGNYSGAVVNTTSTIVATCTDTTPYNVGLSAGLGVGATVSGRLMTNTADTLDTLHYDLFKDSARTSEWGNTIGTDTVTGTGNGLGQTLTMYAQIPAGQLPDPGTSYADTISVTLTY